MECVELAPVFEVPSRARLQLLASHRNPDSYVGAGTLLHQEPDFPRLSRPWPRIVGDDSKRGTASDGTSSYLDPTGKPGKNLTMNSATISTKGQLVIPNHLRKALHLQAGEKVSFSLEGDKLVLQRKQPRRARLARGKFGRPVLVAPQGAPPMTPDRVKAILNELGEVSRSPFG